MAPHTGVRADQVCLSCSKGGLRQWIKLLQSFDMPELEAYLTTNAVSLSSSVPALQKLVLCNLLSPPFMSLATQQRLIEAVEDEDAPEETVKALKSVPVVDVLALRMYMQEGGLTVLQVFPWGSMYTLLTLMSITAWSERPRMILSACMSADASCAVCVEQFGTKC